MAILDVRRGERLRTLLLFLYVLSASALFGLGRNVRDTLLLGSFPMSIYPWMFVAYAVVSSFVAVFYGRIADKVKRERLMFSTLAAGVATYVVVWLCSRGAGLPAAYPVFWCLADVVANLVLLQFWAFANELHDARDAKRLFALIGSGFSVGMGLCGFGASALARRIGAANLLLVMVGLAGAVALLIVSLRGFPRVPVAGKRAHAAATPTASPLAEPYPRILAAMLLCIFVLCPIEQFQFTAIARNAFTVDSVVQKDELARFFGFFYGGLGTIAFFFQLFATPRILSRFGVRLSMRIMPAGLLAASVAVLLAPTLLVASLLRFADNGFQYTVHDATMQILYFPFPAHAKQRLRAFLDALVKPCSYGVGGLIIVAAGTRLTVPQLSLITVPLACLWIALTFPVRKRYVQALGKTLHAGVFEEETHELQLESDHAARQVLLDSLLSPDEEVARFAFDRLEQAAAPALANRLPVLVARGPRHAALLALARIARFPEARYGDAVRARLHDADPEVAGAAVLALAAVAGEAAIPDLEPLLAAPAPEVRAAAVAGLIVDGGLDGTLTAGPRLRAMLDAAEPHEREVAAAALGLVGPAAARPIERLLKDADVRVRLAAIGAAARTQDPRLLEPLGALLDDPKVGPRAGRALARFGDVPISWLHALLEDSAVPLRVRLAVPPILREIATPTSYDALRYSIAVEEGVIRSRVLSALTTLRVAIGRPAEGAHFLVPHLEREAREHYALRGNAERLAGTLDAPPLIEAAQTQARRALARMFRLLELGHHRTTIAIVAHEIMHGAKGSVRANALEVLDNKLEDEEKALLFPALEEGPILPRLAELPTAVPALEPDEWLLALLSHPESWLRACALDAILRAPSPRPPALLAKALDLARDPDPIVREMVALLLRRVRPEGGAPLLEALAQDPDPVVRRAATEAEEGVAARAPSFR
jgi:HEAT repeat protein